jgi:hypothetical protein
VLVRKTIDLVNSLSVVVYDAALTVVVPRRNPVWTSTESIGRRTAGKTAVISVQVAEKTAEISVQMAERTAGWSVQMAERTAEMSVQVAEITAGLSSKMWRELLSPFRISPHYRSRAPFLARYRSVIEPLKESYRIIRKNRRRGRSSDRLPTEH